MVDETNKDETQNEAQAEVSDSSETEQENTANEPQTKELKTDASLTPFNTFCDVLPKKNSLIPDVPRRPMTTMS